MDVLPRCLASCSIVSPLTGKLVPITYWEINRFLAKRYSLLWGMTGLIIIMGIAVVLFTASHLWSACVNETTYERYKRVKLQLWVMEQEEAEAEAAEAAGAAGTGKGKGDTSGASAASASSATAADSAGNAKKEDARFVAGPGGCWPDVSGLDESNLLARPAAVAAATKSSLSRSASAVGKGLNNRAGRASVARAGAAAGDSKPSGGRPVLLPWSDEKSSPLSPPTGSASGSAEGVGYPPKQSPLVSRGPVVGLASPATWPLSYWKTASECNPYDRGGFANILEIFRGAPQTFAEGGRGKGTID